jgi:hypothetical protein
MKQHFNTGTISVSVRLEYIPVPVTLNIGLCTRCCVSRRSFRRLRYTASKECSWSCRWREAKWIHNNGGVLFEHTTTTDLFPLGKLADRLTVRSIAFISIDRYFPYTECATWHRLASLDSFVKKGDLSVCVRVFGMWGRSVRTKTIQLCHVRHLSFVTLALFPSSGTHQFLVIRTGGVRNIGFWLRNEAVYSRKDIVRRCMNTSSQVCSDISYLETDVDVCGILLQFATPP